MSSKFLNLGVALPASPLLAAFLVAAQILCADTNPAYSHDGNQKTTNLQWMTFMQDSITLDQLSIPGSHDTMTFGYQAGFGLGGLFTGQNIPTDTVPIPDDLVVAQSMNLQTQLNSGIRMVDIRCKAISNTFLIYHGDFYVGATFSDVLTTVTSFLAAHPGEAVVMRISDEPAGPPLSKVPSVVNSTLTFEQVFAQYYNSVQWGSYFFRPRQGDQVFYNPTLGQIRGKIVVLVDFPATQSWGLNYSSFLAQDNYTLGSNWDLYGKWVTVKQQLQSAASGSPYQGYLNYLSASTGSFPYFVASGQSSPGTNDPLLWTGLITDNLSSYNTTTYPDFPRKNCISETFWAPTWSNPANTVTDSQCSIFFEGTNGLTESYLENRNSANQFSRTGIVLGDFFGPSVIDRLITQNSVLTENINFGRGQLPLPGGSGATSQCLARPQGGNVTLAANGWETLVWQSDGNLVIYDEKGPRWATGTNSPTTTQLCWQSDGNLVVYDPGKSGGVAFATGTNGKGATLAFQTDCNLVIYDSNGKPLWAPQPGRNSPAPCHR